jgi:hypothetical protein
MKKLSILLLFFLFSSRAVADLEFDEGYDTRFQASLTLNYFKLTGLPASLRLVRTMPQDGYQPLGSVETDGWHRLGFIPISVSGCASLSDVNRIGLNGYASLDFLLFIFASDDLETDTDNDIDEIFDYSTYGVKIFWQAKENMLLYYDISHPGAIRYDYGPDYASHKKAYLKLQMADQKLGLTYIADKKLMIDGYFWFPYLILQEGWVEDRKEGNEHTVADGLGYGFGSAIEFRPTSRFSTIIRYSIGQASLEGEKVDVHNTGFAVVYHF